MTDRTCCAPLRDGGKCSSPAVDGKYLCAEHDVPEGTCISDKCGNRAIGGLVRCWDCNVRTFGFTGGLA